MREFPSIPHVDTAPEEMFSDGHLWLLEKVDGAGFRFQLRESGLIRFGDEKCVYSDHEAVPDSYQHATRHIQEQLDRHAVQQAVENVEGVVFFGAAMHCQRIDYDWERTPSFLGFDIWVDDRETFLPQDAVETIFERLGLEPINAFQRELHTRSFDPDSYTVPQSAWYDGPAEGVVIRDKNGNRAHLLSSDLDPDPPEPVEEPPAQLAERYGTDERFETVATRLKTKGQKITVDTLYERVLETILREHHGKLCSDHSTVDMKEFRSELAARTQKFLEERYAD